MNRSLIAFTLAFALGATASARVAAHSPMSPIDAILRAAEAAPEPGVQGTFLMSVQASGEDKRIRNIYLNSELDYRDQRNLTIEIEPSAIPGLEAKYGKDLKAYFIGKKILVTGTAKRVTIYIGKPRFSATSGKLRSKYYYQTHVQVVDADQIVLAPQAP